MVIEYFLKWNETATVSKRIEAAYAMARAYLRNDITEEERDDIEAALTKILEDPAPAVRAALAETFGARKKAPKHIINALAADTLDVSIITLSQSPLLHDIELVEFIKTSEIDNQIAIACRPWLSETVIAAIAEFGSKDACMAVMMNPVAEFSQDNLHAIAQRFGDVTEIRLMLLERDDIAAETRLILIDKLGSALSSLVISKGWMQAPKAEKAVAEACDKASIIFVANASNDDVTHLVRNMIESGKISVNYLLRAVCMGNITLVAQAFAELSGVRFSRVEAILTKDRKSAFKALYDRAGLPQSAFVIFQIAIASWRRLLTSTNDINQARMQYLVTKEVLESYIGHKDHVVDDLILLLRKLSAEAARDHSRIKAEELKNRATEAEVIVEVHNDVEEVETILIDDIAINTDEIVAEFEKGVTQMQEIQTYDSVEIIEDDYRPDISKAVINVAMAKSHMSKAA